MSTQWHFYSFAKQRWDAIFGGSLEGAEEKVIESVTWDRGRNNKQVPIRIARTIVRKGVSYDGLSAKEAECLDEIITGFFCPEGLQDLLQYEPESPDGLSTRVVDALVDRAADGKKPSFLRRFVEPRRPAGASLLHYLIVGRRHNASGVKISDEMLDAVLECLDNTADRVAMERQARAMLATTPTTGNRYLILASDEISRLYDEVAWALARRLPWPQPSYETTARECLLRPLASARKKRHWLAGRLN